MEKATLYNRDFLKWTEQQIACLQKGQWTDLDVDNLVTKCPYTLEEILDDTLLANNPE